MRYTVLMGKIEVGIPDYLVEMKVADKQSLQDIIDILISSMDLLRTTHKELLIITDILSDPKYLHLQKKHPHWFDEEYKNTLQRNLEYVWSIYRSNFTNIFDAIRGMIIGLLESIEYTRVEHQSLFIFLISLYGYIYRLTEIAFNSADLFERIIKAFPILAIYSFLSSETINSNDLLNFENTTNGERVKTTLDIYCIEYPVQIFRYTVGRKPRYRKYYINPVNLQLLRELSVKYQQPFQGFLNMISNVDLKQWQEPLPLDIFRDLPRLKTVTLADSNIEEVPYEFLDTWIEYAENGNSLWIDLSGNPISQEIQAKILAYCRIGGARERIKIRF